MVAIGVDLLPAIIWGVMPVVLYYIRGSAFEQLLGTTIGTLIVATVLFAWKQPMLNMTTAFWAGLSGLSWSIGQAGQYWAYQQLGISKAFPISAGLQIVGNSLIGGFGLQEWQGATMILKGIVGIVIILIGILAGNLIIGHKRSASGARMIDYLTLILTTIGYWGYSFFPKLIVHENPVAALLPQAIGMVIMAVLLALIVLRYQPLSARRIKLNSFGGMLFGIAAVAYLASVALNGMVNAFLMSQLNMVLATLLGIYLLKEKQHVSNFRLYTSLVLIVAGGFLIVLPG